MTATELTIKVTIPGLRWAPSPAGGYVMWSANENKSFLAVIRRVPGRLVYTRQTFGVRTATGWAAAETYEEAAGKVVELVADLISYG